jgi:glutamine synthetase
MADRNLYFKQMVKEIAWEHNLRATFMAKPFIDDAGNGGHIHLSVLKDGHNIFTDPSVLEHFVAGQLRYMRYLAPIFAPNTNSYRRWDLGHGYTVKKVSYGEEGRDTAVRILGEGENRRIEHRLCGADNNAYLTFAAILAAGLEGIKNQWTYESPEVAQEIGQELPVGLEEALRLFTSGPAASLLGDDFVRVFAAVKNQELASSPEPTIEQEVEDYSQQV